MSAESWIEEFYPLPAHLVTRADAVEHSLKKWTGLRPESLAKHGLVSAPIGIDCKSCALCEIYFDVHTGCGVCPLKQARGNVPCDLETLEEETRGVESPWHRWSGREDPEPMIFWLQKARDAQS